METVLYQLKGGKTISTAEYLALFADRSKPFPIVVAKFNIKMKSFYLSNIKTN